MHCQNCQHENPPGQKFCGECGSALPSRCLQCGAANPSGQKFCGQCGARLQGDDSQTPPAQSYTPAHLAQRILTSRAALEGERKQVTVLFCDIANSTALSQKVGADNMHGVLNRFFELAMAQVHRFEGTINQFLGDGFMALFGAPLAHEDHARRALLAAWGVQQALQENSDGLTLRMGVHTGQVVVGKIGDNLRMDYTAVGDTTNLAARLQQHAQPGTVLVSELTFHLAGGGVQAEPMPPMSLKGIAEPVKALRLLGIAPRRSALGAGEDRLLSGFVGRSRELSALLDAMEQARAGRGQVIGIVGEPGSGKSRLLYEFRQRIAQEPATYLEGRCVSFGKGIAYLPLQEIARANCGISDADAALDIGDKVRRALQEVGIDAQERAPYLLHLIGVKEGTQPIAHTGPETIKARIFDTLRQMSLKGASKQLLIFCVEDLHWMDGVSEEYLSAFVDALSNAPILLITTYRPGYSPPWMDRSFCTQVSLRPLSSQDSTSIVRSVQQRVAMLSDEEVGIVIKKAEGNPFFLEELARVMTERGSDVIPETIQGVLAARIDRLPESARRLLQCASVLGRDALAALLRRISDETTPFDELVQILKRAELMHERAEGSERTLVFKHVLTQEVAYSSLLVGRRQSLHEIAGRAIEALYGDQLDAHLDALAYHYSRSTYESKAIDYLELAFAKAARTYALQEAKSYFDQAHALMIKQPWSIENIRRRMLLLQQLEPVMLPMLKMPEYYELLTAARPDAERSADAGAMGLLYTAMAHALWTFGRVSEAETLVAKGIDLCHQAGLVDAEGHARSLQPWIYMHMGRYDLASACKDEAAAVVEMQFNLRWYTWVYLGCAWARMASNGYQEAESEAITALEAGRKYADDSIVSISAVVLSDLAAHKGDIESAVKWGEVAMAHTPTPFDLACATLQYGYAKCLAGDLTQGISMLEAVTPAMRATGLYTGEYWTLYLGRAYILSKRHEDARALASGFLEAYQHDPEHYFLMYTHLLLGDAHLGLRGGDSLQHAEQHYLTSLRKSQAYPAQKEWALCEFGLGLVRANQGRIAEAKDFMRRALERFERHGILLEPERVRAAMAALPQAS